MKHVMVDLETMGTGTDAAIIAIGAVEFNPYAEPGEDVLGRAYYANVNLQSSIDAGLTVDGDTVMWWLQQEDAARLALRAEPRDIAVVICEFSQWYQDTGAEYVWARGIDFDIAILKTTMRKLHLRQPFVYNASTDSRTVFRALSFDEKALPPIGTAHNALDDARFEAVAVTKAYQQHAKNMYDLALLRNKGRGEDPSDAIMEHLIRDGRPPIIVSGDNGIKTSGDRHSYHHIGD